jgi:hypothetical protein
MAVKPLANTVALGSASNIYLATAVLLTNDGTSRTFTVANTRSIENGGGIASSIRVPANGQIVIRKRPTDTVAAVAAAFGTKVAEGGEV